MVGKESMAKSKISPLNFMITVDGFQLDIMEDTELSTEEMALRESFEQNKYQALLQLSFQEQKEWYSVSLTFLYRLSDLFQKTLLKAPELEILRENLRVKLELDDLQEFLNTVPFIPGSEYVTADWMEGIWQKLNDVYRQEIKQYNGTVEMYLTEKNQNIRVPGRIFFHLVENPKDELPFAFMATYSRSDNGKYVRHVPLKYALEEYKNEEKKLLELMASLGRAADKSNLIAGLMETGELFYPLKLTASEAYTFLKEIPLYEEAGILCRMPNWWKKKNRSIGLTVSIGDKKPSYVGLDSLISVQPKLSFDGENITVEELKELLMASEGLALLKGKWVEVDYEKLQHILDAYEKVADYYEKESLTLAEAMRLELNPEQIFDLPVEEDNVQVTNGIWMKQLRKTLDNPSAIESESLPKSFQAQLRPYQNTGVTWLSYMRHLGFGACLADDMGLGKTVQVIALMEKCRTETGGHVLLIVPASLLGNWEKELKRFAPELPFQIQHGKKEKEITEGSSLTPFPEFLTITTYGMITKDETFGQIIWDMIILDEAQAIKNPGTKQTKAMKQLKGRMKIALTGTPIENRLSELWSLFDFLNPGLLGSAKEFGDFSKKMIQNNKSYQRLRNMIHPFILRRLKTDKKVIQDLPEKIEIKEHIALTKKQIALYRNFVKSLEQRLETSDGIERKGLVLAALMKCKQICNHPDQYLGQQEYKAEASGKFLHLQELCETIYEKRERVLVFTQFKEMTEPLAAFLEQIFHRKGLVINGSVPPKKRTELVEQFNGEAYVPFMVLSLKAGGVGLNLTAANHVIHFDRWWNPAVENQATDRAFRIGQRKNVFVYKMIADGTIEEKIDQMIADKEQLLEDVISSGKEAWITELSNREIMDLFRMD